MPKFGKQWEKERQRQVRYHRAVVHSCMKRLGDLKAKCPVQEERKELTSPSTSKGPSASQPDGLGDSGEQGSSPTVPQGRVSHHAKVDLMELENVRLDKKGHFERAAASAVNEGPLMDQAMQRKYQDIEANDEVMNQKIDSITQGVQDLKFKAVAIGDELHAQHKALNSVTDKMDSARMQLNGLHSRMNTFTEETLKPQHCVLNFICLVGLLALAGYLITTFSLFPIPI